MIRRPQPIKRARPWAIELTVNGTPLTPKRPLVFLDAAQAKTYADQCWRGVQVRIAHERTGEAWTRGAATGWTHHPAPARPAQPAAPRAPQWWERD